MSKFYGFTYIFALYFVTFIYGMFLYLLSRLSPRALEGLQVKVNMSVVRMLLFSAGVKVHRVGHEHITAMEDKSYLMVSNHITTLDPPVLMLGTLKHKIRIIYSLRAASKVPLIGKLVGIAFYALSWISIKHGEDDSTALKRVINEARRELRTQGRTQLCIFPEGIRTEDGKINDFQTGPFFLSLLLQIPILPVIMQGVYSIHRHQTFDVHPGEVTVRVLAPIYPPKVDKKNIRQQADELKARVEYLYKEFPNVNLDAHAHKGVPSGNKTEPS